MHCPEARYKENVRHEIHEQAKMHRARRSPQCFQRIADNAETRAPFPSESVVSSFSNY